MAEFGRLRIIWLRIHPVQTGYGDLLMAQTRLTPRYYQQFQCIGDRCENNCCQGWSISIDKASYQHYLKHPQLKILARELETQVWSIGQPEFKARLQQLQARISSKPQP